MSKLTDLVKADCKARFLRYQSGELWYAVDEFHFPVPITDTGEGVFLPVDRAVFFMRWIRKHLATIEAGRAEQE